MDKPNYFEYVLKKKFKQLRTRGLFPDNMVDLLEHIVERQQAARKKVDVGDLSQVKNVDDASIHQGVALVRRADIPIDLEQAIGLLHDLLPLLDEESGVPPKDVGLVRKALEDEELTPTAMFSAYLDDGTEFFESWSRRTPGAPRLVEFMAASSLFPSLEAASDLLAERLPDIPIWKRGTCPVCGSLPLISSLKNKEGARFMTCSFCHHQYRVQRLNCPICGETDHDKLRFFTVDDEPGFRVDVCSTCNFYIKTIDFRALDRVETPLLDDLFSLVLDHVAQQNGFKRPTLSAWRF